MLERERRELERRLRIVHGILKAAGVGTNGKARGKPGRPPRTHGRLQLIADVLRAAGKPLTIAAIYEGMKAVDPALNWSNVPPIFRTYVRRQEDGKKIIVRCGRGLYGLREWAAKAQAQPTIPHK
jgi:hypothetical protein